MDEISEKRLREILRKEPAALVTGDIDFLRARRSYLTASDLERYAEVLAIEDAESSPKGKKKNDDK